MKSKFILLFTIFLLSITSNVSADYSSGLSAYKQGNYLKALAEWFPLAEQGIPQAQYNLAGMYTKGYGVKIDDEKAIFWYTKAAEQGHSRSQYNLGVMHLIGTGTNKSIKYAKYWLHLAYDSGIEEAEDVWKQNNLWNY